MILLSVILFSIAAIAETEVDYLALSAVLVNDGNYSRAKIALDKIDTTQENFDTIRFHSVYGLYYFGLAKYPESIEQFQKVVHQAPELVPFLAQAELKRGQPLQALKWLNKIAKLESANIIIVKFKALSELNRKSEAYQLLQIGIKKFPENKKILLHNCKFLLGRHLVHEAEVSVQSYLSRDDVVIEDFIHISQLFNKHKRAKITEKVLQRGRLNFPDNEKLNLELAFLLVKENRLFSAYQILSALTRTHSKFYREAAEIAKQIGRHHQAIYLNSMISDQKEKVIQRLSIEISMQNFTKAISMTPKLNQLDLFERDEVNYAVAYSHYNLGQFNMASKRLSKLRSNKFFEQASTLRKAMADCGDNVALCM